MNPIDNRPDKPMRTRVMSTEKIDALVKDMVFNPDGKAKQKQIQEWLRRRGLPPYKSYMMKSVRSTRDSPSAINSWITTYCPHCLQVQ
jgi:hypothetical protein